MQPLLSIIVGVISGLLAGLFGVGGGIVTTPLLRILLGVSERVALGTPLLLVIPAALSGAYTYHKRKLVEYRTAMVVGAAGVVSAVLGAMLTVRFSGKVMMYFTAGFILLVAVITLTPLFQRKRGIPVSAVRPPWWNLAMAIAIGLVAGFFSGFLGIGGGFILVPAFIMLLDMEAHMAVATSLVALCVYAIPGSIVHYMLGNIDLTLVLLLGVGTVIGAQIGSRLTMKIPERQFKMLLSVFFMLIAVGLVWFELTH